MFQVEFPCWGLRAFGSHLRSSLEVCMNEWPHLLYLCWIRPQVLSVLWAQKHHLPLSGGVNDFVFLGFSFKSFEFLNLIRDVA